MKLSPKGIALVKSFEGCLKAVGSGMFVPYICPAGVLTIGWGHTNDGGRPFDKSARWSQAECDKALADDMVRYEDAVKRRVKVPLTQGQFDALTSFCYNCGEGNLAKSTLLRCVNARDFEGAADAFAAWNKGGGKVLKGLTRRRAAEAALFRSGGHSIPVRMVGGDEPDPMAQRVDVPDDDTVADTPIPEATAVVPVDAPTEAQENQMQASAEADVEPRGSWLKRKWRGVTGWFSGVGGIGVLGYLTDPWVIVAIGCVVLVAVVIFILWMGPGDVRAWIRKQVS